MLGVAPTRELGLLMKAATQLPSPLWVGGSLRAAAQQAKSIQTGSQRRYTRPHGY